jgi:uncharacterized protein YndB with AHSA1/START domain
MGDAAPQKRNSLHVEVPPGQPIIIMKREFDFPRDFVWDVYTDAVHMKNWWGPRIYDTVVHEFDFRNGGKWRVDNVSKDGKEVHPFKGEFSNIRPKTEFTWTFGYADFPPGTETYRFLDIGGGRTRIESVSHFPDVASRDGMVASGMEQGAIETYERLEEVLAGLSRKRTHKAGRK